MKPARVSCLIWRPLYDFRQQYPQALLSLDIVSSAPYPQIDWQQVDMAYFSVQKGMGLPAGLGVLIASPATLERADILAEHRSTGSYHRFASLKQKSDRYQTPATPNMLAIWLLGRVGQDMLDHGIDRIRKETEGKAYRLYAYAEQSPHLEAFVSTKGHRSTTVIVMEVTGGAAPLIAALAKRDLIVGAGYGKMKGRHIRIANFPTHSQEQVCHLIRQCEELLG